MTQAENNKSEEKNIVKIKNNSFFTLEKFLTPIIEKFAFRPEKDFARYIFGTFNNKKIYYWAINGEMCFTFKDFALYLSMKFDSVRKAFQRQNLIEGKHYFRLSNTLPPRDKMSHGKKSPKYNKGQFGTEIYLTFLGIWKLLPTFRGDIPTALYEWFGEKLYEHLKTYQLQKGQFFLSDQAGKIVEQILGDPNKNYIDCRGFRYTSKGELLIANILHGMNIPFQYNAPIDLPSKLQSLLDGKFKCNWNYITSDFLIRSIPRTVIEYWGIINDKKYDWKRTVKETCYLWLGIKLISIEAHEDQNAPELKKKLRNLLNIKGKDEK